MKQSIYILTLVFGFWSCNNKTSERSADQKSADPLQTVLVDKPKLEIYIKDQSKYDQTFIDGFVDYNEPIKLIENYIITSKDTTYFPEELKLNKEIIFKAANDKKSFLLSVTRTNLTNINYKFQLLDKNNSIIDSRSGKAVLGSMFFLASEVDEDGQTGESYGSSEYWDKTENCWFSIRVGFGVDDNGKQRAVLNYSCEEKKEHTLNLDECPTLRTE